MAQTPVKDVAFSHIDLLKTVVDFKMKFSLFGKVFLLYINSFLYVFHHFYSFFHNGELVLLNDYTQFVKLKFLKGYFTWMVR